MTFLTYVSQHASCLIWEQLLSKHKTFVKHLYNFLDVGPTLYRCHTNVLCLLYVCPYPQTTRMLLLHLAGEKKLYTHSLTIWKDGRVFSSSSEYRVWKSRYRVWKKRVSNLERQVHFDNVYNKFIAPIWSQGCILLWKFKGIVHC